MKRLAIVLLAAIPCLAEDAAVIDARLKDQIGRAHV